MNCCGGKMCHADLESLRLEICLIKSRVSKTRDSIRPNQILIESRVSKTQDSMRRNQLIISGNSHLHSSLFLSHYLRLSNLSPKNRASSTLTHTLSSLPLTPLTLTHHIASLTAFPSQQFHISGKGFLI